MSGPFSRMVDLIQSEYGWTDPVILDLSLGRALQIVEVIQQRNLLSREFTTQVAEWQTKALAQFVVLGSGIVPNGKKAMLKSVDRLAIFEEEREKDERPIQEVVEQGALPDKRRTRPGSFEAFMRMQAEARR